MDYTPALIKNAFYAAAIGGGGREFVANEYQFFLRLIAAGITIDANGNIAGPGFPSNTNASLLTTGTLPLGRLSGITTAQLDAAAGITAAQLAGSIPYAKLLFAANIVNADIALAAAIAWSKISKSGSSLADLATRSASDLNSGNLPAAQLPSGAVTWAPTSVAINAPISNSAQPRCVAYHNTTQSAANNTTTALSLNSEDVDTAAMHDTVTNNSRITIPTGGDGFYMVVGAANFAANATGYRDLLIRKGGSSALAEVITSGGLSGTIDTLVQVSWMGVLAAADYLELCAVQNSGGNLNIGSASRADSSMLSVVKLW